MIDSLLVKLAYVAESEFADVVTACEVVEGIDNMVRESLLPNVPEKGLRYVLDYVRELVYKNKSG